MKEMMLISVFMILVIILVIIFAHELSQQRISRNGSNNLQSLTSPIAEAIGRLVAVAGGIYITLLLGVDFLKLNIPELIEIYSIQFDPLAAVSIILTLLQPVHLFGKRRIRR